ncbi:MAG: PAS domain-containing protein [Muribaculaceae bacterium]|nr:PAS domain-containing protein [Muribaculaceae bacterium]
MDKKQLENILPDWAMTTNCAITVCDADMRVIYMNEKSRETFAARGGESIIGTDLLQYHNERSRSIIARMMATGDANCYTIEKNGLRKMIYQTPWRLDGKIAGLVEISMVIPTDMPHYVRS